MKLFFLLYPLCLATGIFLFFVRPLKLSRLGCYLAAGGLFISALRFAGFALFGGNIFNPTLPAAVIWIWGFLECIILLLGALFLPCFLSDLLFRLWKGRFPKIKYLRIRAIILFLSAVILASWGIWESVCTPRVVTRELAFSDLPAAFEGYRIVQLSDLHASASALRPRFEKIVARVNAIKPDLIAITGDFVDGFPENRRRDLEPLSFLRARDGVWACTGNHEGYWQFPRWRPIYESWNIHFLSGACTLITRDSKTLAIGGVDDPAVISRHAVSHEDPPGSPTSAIFNDASADAFRILLCHRPKWCRWTEKVLGARLQLSGHTHGGALPILSRFVARFNEGHTRGLYQEGALTLHVSPGTGQWAGFPLRLFNPTEITVLVLHSGR